MTNRLRTEATDYLLAAGRAVGARRFVAQSFGAFRWARTGGPVLSEADPLDLASALQAGQNVVGAIAAEASKERQRQGTVSRPALPPHVEAERQALLRRIDALSVRRYRSRCDNCGAPRRYRADSCRYCGRSLVAG